MNKRHFYVTEIVDCLTCKGDGCMACDGTGSVCVGVTLEDALIALGVMDGIDRANNAAKRAAYEAGCLANGIQPD